MTQLKTDTVKALSWNVGGNIVGKLFAFIISILLARILSPEEFGLMAIVMIFSMIVGLFTDFGFASAIIHHKDVSKTDLASIFYLNVFIGMFFAIIIFISADYLASFFEEEILSELIKIMSVTFIISSISIVPGTILKKQLNFKTFVISSVISNITAGSIAIIMALNDCGVYSLLAQVVIQTTINTLIIFTASKWKPVFLYSHQSIKKYFSFSSHLFLINLISKVMEEIDTVLIAKFYPIANLGVYKRAKNLRNFPVLLVIGGINSVLFPSMSKIQDDNERMKKYYAGLIHIISFILIPSCFLLIIVAKPLVLILLTDKWAAVIPYFQVLMSVGFMTALGGLNTNILSAKGETKFLLKFELIKRIVFSIVIIVSLYWGIMSMVVAVSVISAIFFIGNFYYGGKYIDYKLSHQLKILIPYLIITFIVSIISWILYMQFDSIYLQLSVPLVVGSVLYLFLSYILKVKGLKMLREEIIKPIISKMK